MTANIALDLVSSHPCHVVNVLIPLRLGTVQSAERGKEDQVCIVARMMWNSLCPCVSPFSQLELMNRALSVRYTIPHRPPGEASISKIDDRLCCLGLQRTRLGLQQPQQKPHSLASFKLLHGCYNKTDRSWLFIYQTENMSQALDQIRNLPKIFYGKEQIRLGNASHMQDETWGKGVSRWTA